MNASASTRPDYSTYPRLTMAEARDAARQLIAMRGAGSTVDDVRLLSLQRFYAMEARLLDEERYQEWYELLADDLFYWLPLRQNRHRREGGDGADPDAMAFFDDCKADIAVRVGRLASGLAWTEDPPTRHVYVISNVEGFETGVAGELEVHSTFIQYRNRSEHDDATIVGRRRDLLRIAGDGYMIARRLVLVPQSVLLTKNLSVFF